MISLGMLNEKASWLRREMLKLHKCAPESRIASCLSDIEIFVTLYYGGILRYEPEDPSAEDRDRFIISKGHGAVSLYPVLADLNFFDKRELNKIATKDSFLCPIPDAAVPGFETINGSLGHGLGVACGVAIALKLKEQDCKVFVLCGDGELNEGAMWEAVMFAAYHKLGNLILIVDNNKMSMLGYQENILGLEPLDDKFRAFAWEAERADGHNILQLHKMLNDLRNCDSDKPKVLIADTLKGKGVKVLEDDPLCHVKSLRADVIDSILESFE